MTEKVYDISKSKDAIRVYGWMGDFTGSGVYRMSLPLGQLYQKDVDFLVKANTRIEDWDAVTSDIIICQRPMTEEVSIRLQNWKKNIGAKLILEVDDDIINLDTSNPNYKGVIQRNGIENLKRNAEIVDAITTSTEPLAKVMGEYNDNVIVLPNYIDEELLELDGTPPDKDRVMIGWAGSITHEIDFAVAAAHVKRVIETNKNAWFHAYGTPYNPGLVEKLYFTPWSDDLKSFYPSLRLDIGLAPIRRCLFNDSKSHLKMLEYAALGIAAVASDEPPYRNFVKHGETGFLVKHPAEWKQYLNNLVRNPELRKTIGQNAREYARGWTIQEHYTKWSDAYRKVLNL